MTSGASAINSAAYLRLFSAFPAAQRKSIRTLWPSVQFVDRRRIRAVFLIALSENAGIEIMVA